MARPRPLRAHSLVLRIYVATLIAFVAVMVIIALVSRLFLIQNRREPLALRGRYFLSQVLERPSAVGKLEEMRRIRSDMLLDMSLFGPDGSLRASTLEPPPPKLMPSQLEELGRSGALMLGSEPRGWTIAVPLEPGTPRAGYAILHQSPLPPAGPSLEWTMVLIMLVLLPTSLYLAGAVARPLGRLAEVAQRFGAGELAIRTGMKRRDELGQVAHAFDEMADRVTELLHAQTELLANVSHEFRTPLSRIRIALDLADEAEGEAARESLAEIATDLSELEQLVSDVLTAAKLDLTEGRGSLKLPMHQERLQPSAFLAEAAQRFRRKYGHRVLAVDLPDSLPEIDGDKALLHRVIGNLLDNAQKYSDRDQPIALRAWESDGGVRIEVEDRGIGIDAQDLEQVFQPFFRSDRSRARTTGGVGLGLTLARRIVEAHGGRIQLSSEAGKGTKATVWLPAAGAARASVTA